MRSALLVAPMLLISLSLLAPDTASSQDYPVKPVRINTGNVGGGADFMSRQIAQGIAGPLGQPVIVENRNVGYEVEARAAPDGYTLLVSASPFYLEPLLRKTPYDPLNDFLPITLLSKEPNILAVHPSLPVKSVKEIIALAKAKPGELNYGSGSTGSVTHLAGEMFKFMAGVNIVRIPYKGGGQAVIDLVGGHVQLMFASVPSVTPQIKSGKLKALAVTGTERSALLPDLPTVAASGLPGYEFVGLNTAHVPAKTPAAIIGRLNREIVRYLNSQEAKQKFLAAGIEPITSSPEELTAAIKSQMGKLNKVIQSAGIKAD